MSQKHKKEQPFKAQMDTHKVNSYFGQSLKYIESDNHVLLVQARARSSTPNNEGKLCQHHFQKSTQIYRCP